MKKLQLHQHITITQRESISVAANLNLVFCIGAEQFEIVGSARLSQYTHIRLTLLAAAGGAMGGASAVGGANYAIEILRA